MRIHAITSHLTLLPICIITLCHNKFSMQNSNSSMHTLPIKDIWGKPMLPSDFQQPPAASSPPPAAATTEEIVGPADYVDTSDDETSDHEKDANMAPEKETPKKTRKETPMETGGQGSESGIDLDTTPNTAQMSEEEVSAYLFDLEKRLKLTEVLSKQNKRNLLTVNKNQQILTSRMLRSEREDVRG